MSKVALIVGATGLVGAELLKLLLDNPYYSKVISLQRHTTPAISNSKLEIIQTDFSNLQDISIPEIADGFCCLGTTIKQAGSKKQFEYVDLDLPLNVASLLIRSRAQHYLIISSMGANANSFFFYNQVKGALEVKLAELIDISKITIVRPSLLIGKRKEKRFGEVLAIGVVSAIKRITGVEFGIQSVDVAKAMMHIAENRADLGVHIYESNALKAFATN